MGKASSWLLTCKIVKIILTDAFECTSIGLHSCLVPLLSVTVPVWTDVLILEGSSLKEFCTANTDHHLDKCKVVRSKLIFSVKLF